MTTQAAERKNGLAGILLAAGESTRMGTEKQLLTYAGRSFMQRAVDCFIYAGIADVIVVVGHRSETMIAHLESSVFGPLADGTAVRLHFAFNAAYKTGQLSSIKRGIAEFLEKKGVDFAGGFMIQLIDRPLVAPETFRLAAECFLRSEKGITIPSFEMRRGHPICLAAEYAREILALPEDSSLREVISRHDHDIEYITVNDPGIVVNVDTPEVYERIKGD